jgi:hypothetical protein
LGARALHTVALVRLRDDPATRACTARRRAEGKSPREIRRCVKRAIARQLFKLLQRYDHPHVEIVHVAETSKAGSPACSPLGVDACGAFRIVGATWRIGRAVTMPGRSRTTTTLCAAAPGGSPACRRAVTSQETARKGAGDGRRGTAGQGRTAGSGAQRRDLEWFDALYHHDVVIHWPQSGEVIRGKHNLRELRQAYPTPPTATLRRILGAGDLWAIELDFDYHGDRCHVIVIHQ